MKQFKKRLNYHYAIYLAVNAILVTLACVIIAASLKIYPFGDHTMIFLDGDEPSGFLSFYLRNLTGPKDLLYSWNTVLGGSFAGIFTYDCASPVNLILLFFKKDIILGMHAALVIRHILASWSFLVLLHHFYTAKEIVNVLFSYCYAFIGYFAMFSFYPSWLDGVIILPLLTLGLLTVFEKQKISLLYCISLAYAIFTNYYIGYMLCLYSLFAFIILLIVFHSKLKGKVLHITGVYLLTSVLAAGLAAIVLLPAVKALPSDRSLGIAELLGKGIIRTSIYDLLRGLFTGTVKCDSARDNLPVIYSGMVPLLCFSLYLSDSRRSFKQKALLCTAFALITVSFYIRPLDIIWHGFSINKWFNFRYSFIFSFLLIGAAYESFLHSNIRPVRAGLSAALIILLYAALQYRKSGSFDYKQVIIDGSLLTGAAILLSLNNKYRSDNSDKTTGICCLLILVSLVGTVLNSSMVISSIIETSFSHTQYIEDRDLISDKTAEIKTEDIGRTEKTFYLGRCDSMLFGLEGVTNYSSYENREMLDFLRTLGLEHNSGWARYNRNTPAIFDYLFGIRYIIGQGSEHKQYQTVDDRLYYNANALPVAFPADDRNRSLTDQRPDEVYNAIWKSINPDKRDVISTVDTSKEIRENSLELVWYSSDEKPVYLYIPGTGVINNRITTDTRPDYDHAVGFEIRSGKTGGREILYSPYQEWYYLGTFRAGEKICLTLKTDRLECTPAGLANEVQILCEDLQDLSEVRAEQRPGDLSVIRETNSELYFDMPELSTACSIGTTIPFDEGWHVFADGKPLQTERYCDFFLAFHVPKGTHNVRMEFMPEGMAEGACISVLCFLLLGLYVWVSCSDRIKRIKYEYSK